MISNNLSKFQLLCLYFSHPIYYPNITIMDCMVLVSNPKLANENIHLIQYTIEKLDIGSLCNYVVFILIYSKRERKLFDIIYSICVSNRDSRLNCKVYWILSYLKNFHTIYEKYYNEFSSVYSSLDVISRNLIYLIGKYSKDDPFFLSKINKFENYVNIGVKRNTKKYKLNYPFNLDLDINRIDLKKIEIKNSNSAPSVITLETNEGIERILFKSECVIQDMIISDMISIISDLIEYPLVRYQVLPISTSSGIIQIVPDSETVYTINQKFKFSVQNYLFENNLDSTVSEIRNRFVKSSSIYSIITYLFGIGDRHLDNIMVTKDGSLFHIDFGFILGKDPKPMSPSMRIIKDLIDALGGEYSSYFKEFKANCITTYNFLRNYSSSFLAMFNVLNENYLDKFKEEEIKKHILERFMPNESGNTAEDNILVKISDGYDTFTSKLMIDAIHKQSKEYFHITF